METPKLQITQKKYIDETAVISMRLPKDMLAELDKIATATGRTRNEILTIALDFALNHIEIINREEQ
jgi:metal-responsive CopG/Arc/MetJ family transcriptional regulator